MTYLHVFEDFEVLDVPVCLYAEGLSVCSTDSSPSSLCEWPSIMEFPTPDSLQSKLGLRSSSSYHRQSEDTPLLSDSVPIFGGSDHPLTSALNERSSTDSESYYSMSADHSEENLIISGPSSYLTSLIPSFIPAPSPQILERVFRESCLSSFHCIALTGCLIDRLSNEFYYRWLNDAHSSTGPQHSEIIVVACLIISAKFLVDCRLSIVGVTAMYRRALYQSVGYAALEQASVQNILRIERHILKDIDYNICGLLTDSSLERMAKKFDGSGPVMNYPVVFC